MTSLANLKSWQPGQSGNPNGRPIGSRTAFSQGFMRDLSKVWGNCGLATIEHVARTNKELFFGVCSRLIPQDVSITLEQNTGLDQNDLAILRAIRTAFLTPTPDRQAMS
jgi:hypothetical protein